MSVPAGPPRCAPVVRWTGSWLVPTTTPMCFPRRRARSCARERAENAGRRRRSPPGGGGTVAVLGAGLDCLYPPENAGLAWKIARSGAVVSEFPFGTGPHAGNFPRRNRVIAGWGRGVVVVEARLKSGALVTARCALDEGREVMAVPGPPSQAKAEGTEQLLRDGAAVGPGA